MRTHAMTQKHRYTKWNCKRMYMCNNNIYIIGFFQTMWIREQTREKRMGTSADHTRRHEDTKCMYMRSFVNQHVFFSFSIFGFLCCLNYASWSSPWWNWQKHNIVLWWLSPSEIWQPRRPSENKQFFWLLISHWLWHSNYWQKIIQRQNKRPGNIWWTRQVVKGYVKMLLFMLIPLDQRVWSPRTSKGPLVLETCTEREWSYFQICQNEYVPRTP